MIFQQRISGSSLASQRMLTLNYFKVHSFLLTNKQSKHVICFTREQFHVKLHLRLPSLVRQLFYYIGILPSFTHPNAICILMVCSVLNLLYNLKLSFREILFIYTIKLNKQGKFLLSTCKCPPQIIIGLPDSRKGWVTLHRPILMVFIPLITPWTCLVSLCEVALLNYYLFSV